MGDEASGGSDRLPSNLSGAGVDSDDNTSHIPAQSQAHNGADTPSVQVPVHLVHLPAMADRDRRSRVERACSNIPTGQSRNASQQHRRSHDDQAGGNGGVAEARNRHRDRNTPNTGRNRPPASSSANQRAAAEAEEMEDDTDDVRSDGVTVALTTDLTLLPILQTDFVQAAQSSVPSPHNWQATKSTVKERLFFLFGNELLSDVHFLVGRGGDPQRIPAHKLVLSVGSAVFDAMFNGPMAVSNAADIELPDVEPAAFISMLRFLYTDEVRLGPDIVMQCLYTAKKYAVVALEKACVDYLKRNLCSDNAFTLLTQARLFDEPQLMALCLETIDKTTSDSLAAEGFTDVDSETLCSVLERNTLGIRECKLFVAVCRWAEAECSRRQLEPTAENKREVLGNRALELIRFPLMSISEFAAGPAQSGLLTDREVVDMFLYFTVMPTREVKFSAVPRCCLTGKEQVVSRFGHTQSRWGYNGTSDRISVASNVHAQTDGVRFSVNRKIFIVGFGLYGAIDAPAEYSVNIQILHADTSHVCGTNDTGFVCDGSKATARVLFKEPVEIQANTSYIACATLKGPDSFYGTKGQRKVTQDIVAHDTSSSGKVTFQFTYATGTNNGTSVEDGQIPEIIFYT